MDVRAVPDALHKKAIAFAWQRCGQIPSSSYPLFPSKQALMREYQRNGSLPGGFQIACFEQGSLRGVMFGFAEAETRYLQTTGFYVAEGDDSAAAALAAWLFASYKGYTLNVGLPAENRTVAAALCENGCRLLDDALDLRLRSAGFLNATPGGFAIRRIDEKSLPRYLDFHQAHFGDCYWNAQRLRERFADWQVYALEADQRFTGGLFLRIYAKDAAEIYGLHAETESAAAALLSEAIRTLFAGSAGDVKRAVHGRSPARPIPSPPRCRWDFGRKTIIIAMPQRCNSLRCS